METEKEKLIKKELNKYKNIFKSIDEDKKPFAQKWYEQAAFMSITLNELQDKIKTEGAVIETTNGNGFITYSEHPAQKSYNVMIRNYNATIKHLIDLLPDSEKGNQDELLEFLGRGKK